MKQKKKLTEREKFLLDLSNATKSRGMPRPAVFRNKKKYDRNREKEDQRRYDDQER